MSSEFQERLQLYRDGKLCEEDAREVEREIDKFSAISEFLNYDEKSFLEDLKQDIASKEEHEKIKSKPLKHRVNSRIITTSVVSILLILVIIPVLYFSASAVVNSLFALNSEKLFGQSQAMAQLHQIFQPEYKITGSSMSSLGFAQQDVSVSFIDSIGNTKIDNGKINVRFSFGKPVISGTGEFPNLLSSHQFYALDRDMGSQALDFDSLEKAPKGTKAKVLVGFSKTLTPMEVGELFQNQDGSMEIVPLASGGTDLVLANPSCFINKAFYSSDKMKYNTGMQDKYDSMDNKAQSESFIGNLNIIKDNRNLLEAMYNDSILNGSDIDGMIKFVGDNGIKYAGAYISADSKELLELKGNPLIHSLEALNIVVW